MILTVVLMTSLAACAADSRTGVEAPSSSEAAGSKPGDTVVPPYRHVAVPLSAACRDEMRKAAALGKTDVGQTPAPGDHELKLTATACSSVDEWASALVSYPDAFGTIFQDKDLSLDLGSMCSLLPTGADAVAQGLPPGGAAQAAVCVDAVNLGLNTGPARW